MGYSGYCVTFESYPGVAARVLTHTDLLGDGLVLFLSVVNELVLKLSRVLEVNWQVDTALDGV